MKLATIILATALALSGTSSFAQTEAPGSPAARQWIGDPLTQKPTYEEMRRGVTTGNRNAAREQIGGTAESQQSGTLSGGGSGGGRGR